MSPKIKRRAEVIGDCIARTKPKRGVVFQMEEAKRITANSVALHHAIRTVNISVVAKLLDDRADINFKDKYGNAPLHRAVGHNNYIIVKLLLQRGADVHAFVSPHLSNSSPYCGWTALHIACQHRLSAIARLLLLFGADITLTDNRRITPLQRIPQLGERQVLYEFAQLCPAECWRRRRELICLYYSQPASSSTAATTLMHNKDAFFHIVSFL
jgi:hypothetical protein